MAKIITSYQWETYVAENALRFDTNTLPVPPPSVKRFLGEMKNNCSINEYTDPSYARLTKLVAEYEGVKSSMVAITNSGDEAIDILSKSFLDPGDRFITTPPTYEMFALQSEINRGINVQIPLEGNDFQVNEKKIIVAAKDALVKMIFLCNPNNPTGTIIPQETIETIVQHVNCIVIVDEVYREFYGKSVVPLIKRYPNLVVLRSFSKFAALAGARIGYLIANEELTEKFNAIRFPMGVSFLSNQLAQCVLRYDREWIEKQVEMIKQERSRLTNALELLGFIVIPSQANFLLVKFGSKANDIYKQLKRRNIYIRDRSSKKYLEGSVRITVRSPRENDMLINAVKEILYENKYAFLDRDGTLIYEPQDTFQIDSLEKLKILDGVIKGLKKLTEQDYELIMISNQDGLGISSFPQVDFEKPQNKMLSIFEENGITFKKIFICPHLPSKNCGCRKPKIGLVKKFLRDNTVDKNSSFVCGDRKTDELFAQNIGIKFIPMQTNGNFYSALTQGGINV